jgi:DNA repair protein RecO
MSELVEDDGLVLRKTPYSETSLIAALLTREHGQVHVLLKGARRSAKRQFPAIDLFREVRIQFQPVSHRELHSIRGADLLQAHDGIAQRPAHYRLALWLTRFMLANTQANVPVPRSYTALAHAFARLAQPEACEHASLLSLCFTIADESGVLPSYDDPRSSRHIAALLTYAADANSPTPSYSAEIWAGLRRWMYRLLAAGHFALPQGLDWCLDGQDPVLQ